jgi:hypothetical protein
MINDSDMTIIFEIFFWSFLAIALIVGSILWVSRVKNPVDQEQKTGKSIDFKNDIRNL